MPSTHIQHISSLQNPRVKATLRLWEHRERRETGLFLADGLRHFERAMAAGLCLRELFWCPELAGDDVPGGKLPDDVALFTVTRPVMDKLAYQQNPDGIVGVFEQRSWRLEDVLSVSSRTPGAGLWLVAVGIEKPGNLGAMARSADAAGAAGILVADAVVDAFNPNAIRASTGAVFHLPIAIASAEDIRHALRQRNITLAVTTPAATTAYWDADLTRPTAVVIGAEDRGLDARWLEASGDANIVQLAVPMSARAADSLNASVVAALVLFEAIRQRRGS